MQLSVLGMCSSNLSEHNRALLLRILICGVHSLGK